MSSGRRKLYALSRIVIRTGMIMFKEVAQQQKENRPPKGPCTTSPTGVMAKVVRMLTVD